MFRRLTAATALWLACFQFHAAGQTLIQNARAQIVCVENSGAISNFQPNAEIVQTMVDCGLTNFTGQPNVNAAWRSLVSTQDVVGIKVFSEPGMLTGTRPAVVAAVVVGLLHAGVPPQHVIIWDKYEKNLRTAGFFKLAAQLGVRAAGGAETGWDPATFYRPDTAVIGNLIWGDLEFGQTNFGVGRNSFVSKLVSQQITKIISIAPLLNQEDVGVCGQLYSLTLGSVDNTRRFEGDAGRLATAVPEIYALPILGDRVVLNITDALLGQYSGGPRGFLQYSTTLNQIWFSRDPVALDLLALRELQRERLAVNMPAFKPNFEIYTNAVLLELGVGDPGKIRVEKTLMTE
jgi:hypothetical protein